MKNLLFLDDWFLDSKVDVVRRFGRPRRVDLPDACTLARATIIFDEATRRYRAWQKFPIDRTEARHFECTDGLHWYDTGHRLAVTPGQHYPFEETWTYDRHDPDPARRYKMLVWPYETGTFGGDALIACSPDGFAWTIDRDARWHTFPNGSDTVNNLFYNPRTRRWCAVCRKCQADRRIAMAESEDLHRWTEPRTILQPDAGDPDLMQMYGMPVAVYDDEYFIGLVHRYHVAGADPGKMCGHVDAELAYSYDGQYWLRPDRTGFIGRSEPGTYGGGCIYPHAIVPGPDRQIHIYSLATLRDHGADDELTPPPPGFPSGESLVLHTLRRDGFAWLEPAGGWGSFTLRSFIPQSPHLSINVQTPVGRVRVQATDPDRKPIPGYLFDDGLEITGDDTGAPVRWKNHPDLSGLVGQRIHLEFQLFDARIYAVRLHAQLAYTGHPRCLDYI